MSSTGRQAYKYKSMSGFTLIELILTLTILAILATVAVPSMARMIANNELTSQTNTLVGDINLMRSEAIRRSQTITMCKSTNSASCTNASQWNEGWIIFEDLNGNNIIDNNETLIRANGGAVDDPIISFNDIDGGQLNFISFDSNGRPASTIGTFTVSDHNNLSDTRAVEINSTGRTSSQHI